MDSSAIHGHMMKKTRKSKGKREGVKVVYISSPVKVKTCASRFRALVQELTGRDSDVSRFTETNGAYNSQTRGLNYYSVDDDRVSVEPPHRESPTSSDSLFDDVLITSHGQDSFLGMFPSSFSFEASELDVLGSYDAL